MSAKRPIRSVRNQVRRIYGPRLKRRGNFWWIYGTIRGLRLRESTGEVDHKRAKLVLDRRLSKVDEDVEKQRAINRGEPPPPRLRTFWEACKLYASKRDRGDDEYKRIRKVQKFYGPHLLCQEFNQDKLEEGFKAICEPQSSQATEKRQVLTPVRAILTAAHVKWGAPGGCYRPSFEQMSDGNPRTRVLLPSEACSMNVEARSRGFDLMDNVLKLNLGEGLRRSEVLGLEWENIDLVNEIITVRVKSPRGTVRIRTINDPRPSTLAVLRSIRDTLGNPSGPVFRRPDGTTFPSAGAFGAMLNEQLLTVARAIGLLKPEEITLHVIRHTCASWHYSFEEKDIYVMQRMDWESPRAFAMYVHRIPRKHIPGILDYLGLDQH